MIRKRWVSPGQQGALAIFSASTSEKGVNFGFLQDQFIERVLTGSRFSFPPSHLSFECIAMNESADLPVTAYAKVFLTEICYIRSLGNKKVF